MRKISSSVNQRCRSSFSSRAESRSWPNGFSTISRTQPSFVAPLADLGHRLRERLRRDAR